MNQTVNIPFSIRLEPGESQFSIEVDKRFTDNPNRMFSLATVTLTPDYYSQQAFKLNLDSDDELKAKVESEFSFEVEYFKNVYLAKSYTSSSVAQSIGTVIKNINTFHATHKPAGMLFPPLVFDWIHVNALGKDVDAVQFYKDNAKELYGEEYNEAKHRNALPQDFLGNNFELKGLNDFKFPTNPDVMDFIRIRMVIAPHVKVAFSNDMLPLALGFSELQMPHRQKGQYNVENPYTHFVSTLVCHNKPDVTSQVFTTKISLYPNIPHVKSDTGMLVTTKERERTPEHLAQDYSAILSKMAKTMFLDVKLEHVAEEKLFKLIVPTAPGLVVKLRVSPNVATQLGYGHVSLITQSTMTPKSYSTEVPFSDVETLSRVLVYDTGMIVISLDQQGSQQTHQFTNTVMAILDTDNAGVLTTKPGLEFSRVPVSPFNPNLDFVLYKYSEANQPIPLDWKVGSYIRGLLVGKV